MPLLPLVAMAIALVHCLADPSAIHSPQSYTTTKATAGTRCDSSTADISSKLSLLPPVPRDKITPQLTSICYQNINGFCTDAKIRGACIAARENRIPCTILLETHRRFDQCLKFKAR
jgi:hypothetical protein